MLSTVMNRQDHIDISNSIGDKGDLSEPVGLMFILAEPISIITLDK